ncbi:MAG: hypothetical protein JWL59_4661 [Chthoniobacteraceae bacterium]|nr:hypothetical protein [Chthoniobacteraceae bacterium]
MDSKSLVTRIAFLIVGFSVLNLLFWGMFVGSRGMVGNIIGLVINGVLAYFLLSGHGWARWWMAIRCGIGAITLLAAWSDLGTYFSVVSVIRLWLLGGALLSAGIGLYLVLSTRVNEHFNPSSGF